MNYSTKIIESKAKNIVGLITVKKIDLANPVCKCSTFMIFMKSLLVAPWLLTQAALILASANSKPHHYKQKVRKTKDFPKTWVLMGKQFEDFRRKKTLLA